MSLGTRVDAPVHVRVERWRVFFAILFSILLGGCAVPRVAVDEIGNLDVLGPAPGFAAGSLPGDWVIEGVVMREQAAVAERAGVPALKVVSGRENFVLARRTSAQLLATPYLSWSWSMDDHGPGNHPVRLVIGFWGGRAESASWGTRPLAGLGAKLPPHDRTLVIGWSDSALKRGSFAQADRDQRRAPLYLLRGGRENAATWWFETVDLADLYRRLWPEDRLDRVQVMFIGLAAVGSESARAAHVSGLRLAR
jgi:hypothetical protein